MTDQHSDDNKLVAERRAKLDAIAHSVNPMDFQTAFVVKRMLMICNPHLQSMKKRT